MKLSKSRLDLDERIFAAEERVEKLKKERARKINKILLNSFSFLRNEIDIIDFLNSKVNDKEFMDNFKKYILRFSEFDSISRLAKSDVVNEQEGDLNGSAE